MFSQFSGSLEIGVLVKYRIFVLDQLDMILDVHSQDAKLFEELFVKMSAQRTGHAAVGCLVF